MNANYPDVCSRTYYAFEEPDNPDEIQKCSRTFIQTHGLCEETGDIPKPEVGFWRRQFQRRVTRGQKKFDWIFGVILPLVCFFFDPIVFKGGFGDSALLGAYKPFAYLLAYSVIMATMAWLIWGEKLKWLNGFLAGLFAVSGIISLVIGVILAPFSLIGLIVLIGALGFTPLFCSFVFLRNSVRTYNAAKPSLDPGVLKHIFMLAAFFSAVIPYVLNVEIRKGLAIQLINLLR